MSVSRVESEPVEKVGSNADEASAGPPPEPPPPAAGRQWTWTPFARPSSTRRMSARDYG